MEGRNGATNKRLSQKKMMSENTDTALEGDRSC